MRDSFYPKARPEAGDETGQYSIVQSNREQMDKAGGGPEKKRKEDACEGTRLPDYSERYH